MLEDTRTGKWEGANTFEKMERLCFMACPGFRSLFKVFLSYFSKFEFFVRKVRIKISEAKFINLRIRNEMMLQSIEGRRKFTSQV